MNTKIWVAIVAMVLLLGCREKEYKINVRYQRIGNLQKGNPVLLKGDKIVGRVAGIVQAGPERYMATLSIDPENKELITEFATFAIVQDPRVDKQNAIEIMILREGGSALPSGSVVDGVALKSPALLEIIKKEVSRELHQFEKHFDDLSKDWSLFIQELQKVPERQAVKELEKELEKLGQKMRDSNQEWKEKIKKELLPELRKELNRLKEKLQQKGQEDDMQPLEIRMDEIQAI